MNAAQSKAIITAARNVLAILPADTDAALAALQLAVENAEAKAVKTPAKPRKGQYPPNNPRRDDESAKDYFERVMSAFRRSDIESARKLKLKQGREGERIEYDNIAA